MQVCLIVALLTSFIKACPLSRTETQVIQKHPHNDYTFIENCRHVAELKLSFIHVQFLCGSDEDSWIKIFGPSSLYATMTVLYKSLIFVSCIHHRNMLDSSIYSLQVSKLLTHSRAFIVNANQRVRGLETYLIFTVCRNLSEECA